MNRELFGVFGGIETFDRFRSSDEFDEILDGPTVTVGIRDSDLGTPGWSARYTSDDGYCVIWGEVYVPDDEPNAARWLLEQYETNGRDALSALNGSYLAVLDTAASDGAFVATDPVRSRECFYTDEPGVRVFGTDAAEVGRPITEPTIDRDGVLEFLHLGVILGDKTAISDLHRLPVDSRLEATSIECLDRFVYQPQEFDYASELADRLDRAFQRRSALPGPKGVLLSAGYDSRIILSQVSDIDHSYTVGSPDAQEVHGAKRLAAQYGSSHTAFTPDERYLRPDESKIRYSQGIKESLHIHHAGYTDALEVDTMYHGLLCDTFFRGHFTAQDTIDVLDKRIPLGRLDPDPNPVDVLLEKFGYDREASLELAERTSFDTDPERFVRKAIADEFRSKRSRADTVQNTLTCVGIANQPSIPFHNHLSDHFLTSFLATDRELIDWHLQTPPAHRTTDTFLEACQQLDGDILRHRPPDRPHSSTLRNEIEGFVRRKTPFLQSFQSPWPNREVLFDRHDLDRRLLSDVEQVHPLPARHKLRFTDLRGWLECWSGPQLDSSH
ncbi:asparagine synthase-related protein [Natronorubrum thiooxidans]|uniref:Asparagine synthase (Glutamine-hydrolysing) n=1 Tax=Natronorubrum thiooxidans TaxID=308853 RepID=A0A1N7DHB1_9EURY|nr:asparagine synthase-related protein [Natronorubrum thiooxidans]SIR75157.1 asparagine synthase (glutamine-hydrolysing) [Natronorubrum thiooxidans]